MTLEELVPGRTVYTLAKTGTGGKPLKNLSVWPIEIVSVDRHKRIVMAYWNTKRPREFTEATWSRWHRERPMLVDAGKGRQRLATPAEREQIMARIRSACLPSSAEAA